MHPRLLQALIALLPALLCAPAGAQPLSCHSEGQRPPPALLERFMDADCSNCWQDAQAAAPVRGALLLDWVRPAEQGEEAAMSAVALPEALARQQALGLPLASSASQLSPVRPGPRPALRVAQGFVVNGYLGATLRYRAQNREPYTAWLLLVEQLPAGTEGSGVARQMVRAAAEIRPSTQGGRPASRLFETRAFLVPEGARPERLRVLGWVEDAQGRLRALAQTRC